MALVASGQAFFGAVASLQAAAKANLNAKAKLDADARLDGKAKLAADAKAKVDPKLAANAKASLEKGASASVKVTPPNVEVKQSAQPRGQGAGGAKASAGFSIGPK